MQPKNPTVLLTAGWKLRQPRKSSPVSIARHDFQLLFPELGFDHDLGTAPFLKAKRCPVPITGCTEKTTVGIILRGVVSSSVPALETGPRGFSIHFDPD